MLKAIFYARFHPEKGPSVIHQYPKQAIVVPAANGEGLLNFSDISSYVIPAYDLCNQPLAISAGGLRVLGFPVSLEDNKKYDRNRFTFNVCFVLDDTADIRPYDRVVAKTASFFTELETSRGYLQEEERLEGLIWAGDEAYPTQNIGIVYELLQAIFSALQDYGEVYARVDNVHVLNLRLSTPPAKQTQVNAWDVPLLIRPLPDEQQWVWDIALQRIHKHIDGVNHIQRIAERADVEIRLVKQTVAELVRHGLVTMLDIFHFQAIYALTPTFAWFAKDEALQQECLHYVTRKKDISQTSSTPQMSLVSLYQGFGPGTSVRDFCLTNEHQLSNIDIRRLVTFAVIKGFLRRIHKYAISTESVPTETSPSKQVPPNVRKGDERDEAWRRAAFSSGWVTPPVADQHQDQAEREVNGTDPEQTALLAYLNGEHCMDEICVALHMSEKQVIQKLYNGRSTDVVLFNR
jgi:nitrogen permease regulator 2-like protein